MNESPNVSESPESNLTAIYKKECPICHRPTMMADIVAEDKDHTIKGIWYRCKCGVVFQSQKHDKKQEDKSDIDEYIQAKEFDTRSIHMAKTYSPIIEELTYGRKMLDVGFKTLNNINYFKKRGWITFGIDYNKSIETNDRIIQEDFEKTEQYTAKEFDLIWMGSVLEQFHDPITALSYAHKILQDDGVLFIATPDTDFLYSMPIGKWCHWKSQKNYVMWNKKSLEEILRYMGFELVMCRHNVYQRFGAYFNLHLIAQKIFH
jgi:SAM-dependent methyltransferase